MWHELFITDLEEKNEKWTRKLVTIAVDLPSGR